MSKDIIRALAEIEKQKGISTEVLLETIEAALVSSYKKKFNTATNVSVEIDRSNGNVKVFAVKVVVDEIIDGRLEIHIDEAQKIQPDIQLDEELKIEVTPSDFGRLAAHTAKTVVMQRIKEAERELIYKAYSDKEEEIVTGKVVGMDSGNVYISLDQTEAILPLTEVPSRDRFKLGDVVAAYISRVETTSKGTQVYLSRIHPGHLKKLFETKIPEITEGKVAIKSIAREAGSRSKVAVAAVAPEVDAVAACVGVKGAVIQSITSGLNGEKVDIIKWSSNKNEYIANSLAPARVVNTILLEAEEFEDDPVAHVIVPDDQLTLAIGQKGQNVRLAAKLTGYKIDIYSESQAHRLNLMAQH